MNSHKFSFDRTAHSLLSRKNANEEKRGEGKKAMLQGKTHRGSVSSAMFLSLYFSF